MTERACAECGGPGAGVFCSDRCRQAVWARVAPDLVAYLDRMPIDAAGRVGFGSAVEALEEMNAVRRLELALLNDLLDRAEFGSMVRQALDEELVRRAVESGRPEWRMVTGPEVEGDDAADMLGRFRSGTEGSA